MTTSPVPPSVDDRPSGVGIGEMGGEGTLLLSGPPAHQGLESLDSHIRRLGRIDLRMPPGEIRAAIRASGLQGRGGGGFPLSRKLDTALLGVGEPLLIVNASESEPASHKDRTLCSSRAHLVLDGAAAVACVLGTREVVLHLHRGASDARAGLVQAMEERVRARLPDPPWRMSVGPDRYIAGESSAVARFVETGVALPTFTTQPVAVQGPSGRPTVVSNAETIAHVALILRLGAEAWRCRGPASHPGPQLVTVGGAVTEPDIVREVTGAATIGEILSAAGVMLPPAAVLLGGYAGTWMAGDVAWFTLLEPSALRRVDAARGCGFIGVLPHGACGVTETARLAGYLAGESAGQCGPCVHGLPSIADLCASLAQGALRARGLRRLRRTADAVQGSGACSHPDGAVRLVRSMLNVFEDDVIRHLAGRSCRAAHHPPVFPVPSATDPVELRR